LLLATKQKGRELNAPPLEAPRIALEKDAIKPRPMGRVLREVFLWEIRKVSRETGAEAAQNCCCLYMPARIRFFACCGKNNLGGQSGPGRMPLSWVFFRHLNLNLAPNLYGGGRRD
jgi:hypothetical protein